MPAKKIKNASIAPRFAAALTLSLILTGCAAQAELPPQMTTNLADMRDELQRGKAQFQSTCNAARDLTQRPQAQIEPQVDRLIRSIASLDGIAANQRQNFASADERAQAYFAKWDQQMTGMSKSLAEKGQERRAESMATFEELKTRLQSLKSEFRPVMSSFLEVSKYLQTDTTAAGVKAVKPQLESALSKENQVTAKINAVIAQIDAMRGNK